MINCLIIRKSKFRTLIKNVLFAIAKGMKRSFGGNLTYYVYSVYRFVEILLSVVPNPSGKMR